ncbi:hypothetical protein HPB48_026694 [Haemaphysalis longicornis]|uniref:GB1/RHD3-type G domain-containing protein n=1 Tax=Haemaphysalis longicornis TaxID=44386 RepID=A0A9J6HBC7_HAELO|nr:hypothetical protein HPB48_026694 [Haemaphysalis longicornis]
MFLRYMRNEGRGDWLGDAGAPVDGFSCSSGSERHTGGILVWSEVFLVTRPKGGQVAVVLMDTQGTFDTETTFEDVTTIFALSALTSSVQVYNLMSNIREDDLEHLQYFIEYGRMVQNQDSSETPFQNLVFLVRDWSFVSSYEYGSQGGKKLLNERLKTSGKKQEQKTLRERMKSCFQNMDCFLMPYPGNHVRVDVSRLRAIFDCRNITQVATGQFPEGCLPPMDGTFKPHLQAFVDSSLAADKLVPKRMNGRQLSGREWLTYFSKYAEVFQSGKLPKPKTLLEVTAAANNEAVRNEAKAMYEKGMEEVGPNTVGPRTDFDRNVSSSIQECGENKPFKNKWDMNHLHKAQRKAALDWFTSRPKMGREDVSKVQKEILKKEIEVMRKRFFEANKNKYCKNTVLALSVPGVLTAGGGIVLAFVGGPVGAAATVTSLLIAGTVVGVLHVWTNTVMSGKTTALREGVDNGVDYVCQRIGLASVHRGSSWPRQLVGPRH